MVPPPCDWCEDSEPALVGLPPVADGNERPTEEMVLNLCPGHAEGLMFALARDLNYTVVIEG